MDKFEKTLKQALEDKARGMDAATLSRLRRARETALDTPLPWWRSIQARTGATIDLGGVLSHNPGPTAATLGILILITVLAFTYLFNHRSTIKDTDTLELMEIISLDADLDLVEVLT